MMGGATDSTRRVDTWGYRPDGDAQIFKLAPGEALPDGWHASPTCITDPALATAEALSARQRENERTGGRPDAPTHGRTATAAPRAGTVPPSPAVAAPPALVTRDLGLEERLAAAIGSTVLEGVHTEPLEYVLRRGYAAMGLPPSLAAEMCRRLAVLRVEDGPQDLAPAGAIVEAPAQVEVVPPPDPAAASDPVQIGQPPRTREEAREAVRALLAEDLTDREIARRVGVSPSTVAAVRRAAQAEQGNADA